MTNVNTSVNTILARPDAADAFCSVLQFPLSEAQEAQGQTAGGRALIPKNALKLRETQGRNSGNSRTDGTFLILFEKIRFAHNDWRFSEWGNFPSVPSFSGLHGPQFPGCERLESSLAPVKFSRRHAPFAQEPPQKISGRTVRLARIAIHAAGNQVAVRIEPGLRLRHHVVQAPDGRHEPP